MHWPRTMRERLMLPASARRSAMLLFLDRSEPARSMMLNWFVWIVPRWVRNVFSSIVKMA